MYFPPKNDTIKTFLHNPFFEVRILGLKICREWFKFNIFGTYWWSNKWEKKFPEIKFYDLLLLRTWDHSSLVQVWTFKIYTCILCYNRMRSDIKNCYLLSTSILRFFLYNSMLNSGLMFFISTNIVYEDKVCFIYFYKV